MLKNFVFLGQIFIQLKNRRHIATTGYPAREYTGTKGKNTIWIKRQRNPPPGRSPNDALYGIE
jgi:hypothetical protein